jgi:Ca2+-binding RTX toxin-like protein
MPKNKMRRTMVVVPMVAMMLVALVGASSVAFAQVIGGAIQCDDIPCVATGDSQVLFERVGDGVRDRMIAKGDHDLLRADGYTNDRDVAKGGSGHDKLRVDDGDTLDGAIGGSGYDVCYVDAAIEAADTCERVIYR